MSQIITKDFHGSKIRIILIEEKEWFFAKDSAELLGYKRTADAISQHCKKQISFEEILKLGKTPTLDLQPTLGNSWKQTKLIPESDVWRLIIKSKLPNAERIEKWIMEDVLPQIRKTGSYQLSSKTENSATVSEIPKVEKLSITKELEILKFKLENYGYSQKEKIEVSNTLFRKVGADELPIPKKIETHSFQNSFSLTKLLEKHDIQIRTADFNTKLADIGIIEKRGKNWFILNLEFGINEIYENKTNPKYCEKSFANLLKLVFPQKDILELPII